ncbi:60 kDa chaperonin 1 domain protein [Mycobacterium xenopi 3993]|nr:60 kDa chaperonin 1 domain protein [Mycobacterium xenopi 3993]
MTGGQVADLLGDHTGLQTGVERDLLQRSLQRQLDDVGTGRLVTFELELVERRAACSSVTPPPATMPSSTAAFALRTASSMRCLRSFSSTSVAARP